MKSPKDITRYWLIRMLWLQRRETEKVKKQLEQVQQMEKKL